MYLKLSQTQTIGAKPIVLPPALLPVLPPKGPFPRNYIHPLGGIHLLIAENNTKTAALIGKLFERLGARITLSFTDEQTLIYGLIKDVDLIICGTRSESDNGQLVLVNELREIGVNKPIITIVDRHFNSHNSYTKIGVNCIVQKPYAIQSLQRNVHDLLNR